MVMDICSSSGTGSDGETDSGETNYANHSRWHINGGGSNESTAPDDTGSSIRDNGEGPNRQFAAAGGSPGDDSDDSDDPDDGDNDDDGKTNYVNHSKWFPNGNDDDDSPIPEYAGGNVRDNGEGPSRRPAAAGGSPDDNGDDPGSSGNDNGGDESDDSGYVSGARRRKSRHNEGTLDDDTDRDLSVRPDVIDYDNEVDDENDESDYIGDHWSLWPMERLQIVYRQKLDKIQGIRSRAQRRVNNLRAIVGNQQVEIEERDETITDLEGRINNLEHANQELQDRLHGIRPPPIPWVHLLGNQPYSMVYKVACQQLNMSQVITNVHPQLNLSIRPLDQAVLLAAFGLDGGGGGNGNGNMAGIEEGDDDHGGSDNESELSVRQDSSLPPAGEEERPRRYFRFDRLPHDIQERIFRYLFVKKELVHCLSRLDPGNRPLVARPLQRFYWGGPNRQCCVTLAHRPNSVLRLLLVCRRWLYIGVHAFYGLNTFAFSSLGELGRFMKGIGSRMERIVNVELFWHGAIMPRQASMVNQRTQPLQFFCDTRRLRTLVIHLQERDERRTRRKYEKQKEGDGIEGRVIPYAGSRLNLNDPFKALMESTRVQPNHRQYRSIRTMHGLDFVYQLRDMNYVRFKEAEGNTARQNIRDWSIIDDINSVVTRPKDPGYAFLSELDNLSPISGLANFQPTDDDKEIVRRWYADNEPMGSVVGEDDDGDTISVVSSEARSTPSLSGDSDNDGSDDDDSNSPSGNGGGDNDSCDDVDMDIENDSRDDTPSDDDTVDNINEDLDQMSINDDSESVDEDARDNLDSMSTTTDSSGDSDNSSRPHDTGNTGLTSDYSMSANVAGAGAVQGSRSRADTVSSSTADAGDDAADMNIANFDGGKEPNGNAENKNKENGRDHHDADDRGSESSEMFVPPRAESSLFVRDSTCVKTESEEEKKGIIDLTSDDNGGPSRAAGHTSDDSTRIKEESSSGGGGPSRPRPRNARVAGADINSPVEIDDDDEVQSTSSSWKYTFSPSPSAPEYLKRQSSSSSEGQRSPKRRRAETPSESGASEIGSTPDTPIPID